jgi:CO/xanthine dehydrogenase Mo-binding subunit
MTLPPSLARTPRLDRWLRLDPDGSVAICTGKVEIGQGIKTALAMIAADELDVALYRVRVRTADTALTPNELITAGSLSVEDSGGAIRVACATARAKLLDAAAAVLGVPRDSLDVEDGTVTSSLTNQRTDYWSLPYDDLFSVEIQEPLPLKNPDSYRVVGRPAQRLDLPAKVLGHPAFVHDMSLPDMLHGRLVKPPLPGARLERFPDDFQAPGLVAVVRDGSFVGVVAEREEQAVRAAERLSAQCTWQRAPLSPLPSQMAAHLRENVAASFPVIHGGPVAEPVPPAPEIRGTAKRLSATYTRPFQMHGSIGPSAALAQLESGRLTVYSHSQGVELLKIALADVLGMAEDSVRVVHAEGAGCYGHNGADDVALDAALLARAVTPRPVLTKWTRADEHGFEPYAPATVIEMTASLDDRGQILHWDHQAFGLTHMGRPRPSPGHSNLQSAWWLSSPIPPVPREPLMFPEAGIHRNLQPIYDFPDQRLVKHFVADGPLRTSSTRSLGAFANVFAIESFMDECAGAAGRDPFDFRLAHLRDPRAREVLETLRERAPDPAGGGRGIAMARYKSRQAYVGLLVDVDVLDDARVSLKRALIVADAGLIIDPDGLRNQLEGGFIQAASWALKEQVDWDQNGVASRDWESYPIITFSEIPEIETHLIDRRHEPALGAGEASTGPTPAAIANAIGNAAGVRVRDIPFTAEALRRAAAE